MQCASAIWRRRFLDQQVNEQVAKMEHAKDPVDVFFSTHSEVQKPENPDEFFNLISDARRVQGLVF